MTFNLWSTSPESVWFSSRRTRTNRWYVLLHHQKKWKLPWRANAEPSAHRLLLRHTLSHSDRDDDDDHHHHRRPHALQHKTLSLIPSDRYLCADAFCVSVCVCAQDGRSVGRSSLDRLSVVLHVNIEADRWNGAVVVVVVPVVPLSHFDSVHISPLKFNALFLNPLGHHAQGDGRRTLHRGAHHAWRHDSSAGNAPRRR